MKVQNNTSSKFLKPPAKGLQQRRLSMDRIRISLQELNIVGQKQLMVRSRILSKSSTHSKDTDSSNKEQIEIQSEFVFTGFFEEKYEVLEKLGEGSNGVVFKCRKRRTGEEFAAKSFTFEDQHLPALKANFFFLSRLQHPNIIKYEALYIDVQKHLGWLVMEFVNYPSLLRAKLEDEDEIKGVMRKLLDTLKYLHRHDIVHRDIKPENILYDHTTKDIKLIDFGISRRCRKRGVHFDMWTMTGTLFYRAPQMLAGSYRESVDVWAAGVVLYKMICGRTPFESEYHSETTKNIVNSALTFPSQFDNYSSKLKTFLQKMLVKDPNDRLTASKALRDPWFSSIVANLFCRHSTINQNSQAADYDVEDSNKTYCSKPSELFSKPSDDLLLPLQSKMGLSKQMSLISIRSFVNKLKGEEYLCIDSEIEERVSL